MADVTELRRHPRFLVKIPATVVVKSAREARFEGNVINLSMSGALVECPNLKAEAGDEIRVEIHFRKATHSDGSPIACLPEKNKYLQETPESSRVRWTAKIAATGRFGLQFEGLKLDTLEFLSHLLSLLEAHEAKKKIAS